MWTGTGNSRAHTSGHSGRLTPRVRRSWSMRCRKRRCRKCRLPPPVRLFRTDKRINKRSAQEEECAGLFRFVICVAREFRPDALWWNDSVSFEHGVMLVRGKIGDVIDYSGRPANLDTVDFRSRAETEVKAEIIL